MSHLPWYTNHMMKMKTYNVTVETESSPWAATSTRKVTHAVRAESVADAKAFAIRRFCAKRGRVLLPITEATS